MRRQLWSIPALCSLLSAAAVSVADADISIHPDGAPFVVSGTGAKSRNPSVAAAGPGEAIVVWQAPPNEDSTGVAVWSRRVARDGERDAEHLLSIGMEEYPAFNPSIAGTAQTGWMVAWEAIGNADGDESGIFGRLLNTEGVPSGPGPFVISSVTAQSQLFGTVVASPEGYYMAAWEDGPQFGDYTSTARTFDPAGQALTEDFELPEQYIRATGGLPGNQFIFLAPQRRHYLNAVGDPLQHEDVERELGDIVAACPDGSHVIAAAVPSSGPVYSIIARWIGADRQPLSGTFVVTPDQQAWISRISLATVSPCHALAAWGELGPGDAAALFVRALSPHGEPAGETLPIDATLPQSFRARRDIVRIAADTDDTFLAVWEAGNAETADVIAQWFCLRKDEVATCGDATCAGAADGGPTLSIDDALWALRAAVGLTACSACRCDVNASGSVVVSDAATILAAVVGNEVDLQCPTC